MLCCPTLPRRPVAARTAAVHRARSRHKSVITTAHSRLSPAVILKRATTIEAACCCCCQTARDAETPPHLWDWSSAANKHASKPPTGQLPRLAAERRTVDVATNRDAGNIAASPCDRLHRKAHALALRWVATPRPDSHPHPHHSHRAFFSLFTLSLAPPPPAAYHPPGRLPAYLLSVSSSASPCSLFPDLRTLALFGLPLVPDPYGYKTGIACLRKSPGSAVSATLWVSLLTAHRAPSYTTGLLSGQTLTLPSGVSCRVPFILAATPGLDSRLPFC